MSEEKLEKERSDIAKAIDETEAMEIANSVGSETAKVVREEVIQAIRSEFSRPIPPPSIIKGYEEVLPGSADRIIRMAEEQARHRQEMEKKMIDFEARDSLLGILFAFSLGVGCLIAAAIMVILVPQSAGVICGSILGVTGIGSITSSFIRSVKGLPVRNSKAKNKNRGDNNSKQDESEEDE